MSIVHINYVRYLDEFCGVNFCPTCDRPRRMLGQHQEWYGTDWTCAGCGERWSDGEMNERPFRAGWRKENREMAIRRLNELGVNA